MEGFVEQNWKIMTEPTGVCGAGEGRSRRCRCSGSSGSLLGWDPALWKQILIQEAFGKGRRTALVEREATPTFLSPSFKTQLSFTPGILSKGRAGASPASPLGHSRRSGQGGRCAEEPLGSPKPA